jgi:hypothetical protein
MKALLAAAALLALSATPATAASPEYKMQAATLAALQAHESAVAAKTGHGARATCAILAGGVQFIECYTAKPGSKPSHGVTARVDCRAGFLVCANHVQCVYYVAVSVGWPPKDVSHGDVNVCARGWIAKVS